MITLRFTCGEKKIWSNIKKSQNMSRIVTYAQKTQKKVLGAGIPVNKNKPKSERLFGTVYLKIVRNFSSNSI